VACTGAILLLTAQGTVLAAPAPTGADLAKDGCPPSEFDERHSGDLDPGAGDTYWVMSSGGLLRGCLIGPATSTFDLRLRRRPAGRPTGGRLSR
jgi:hypothetical protein